MYPVKQGFVGVDHRLSALIKNGHHGEALLAAVFAMEKTIRRTIRFCALNRGFSSKQCDQLFHKMSFVGLTKAWPVFERYERTLPEFLGNNVWQPVPEAVTMRNNIVHGSRVYKLSDCRDKAQSVKDAIEVLRDQAMQDLGCDPWYQLPGKSTASLAWLGLHQSRISPKRSSSLP